MLKVCSQGSRVQSHGLMYLADVHELSVWISVSLCAVSVPQLTCLCFCLCVQICGVWKNLAKPVMRQLQSEQIRVKMTTLTGTREEVEGKIIKHRALFAGGCTRIIFPFRHVCLCLCVAVHSKLNIYKAAELYMFSHNLKKPRMD